MILPRELIEFITRPEITEFGIRRMEFVGFDFHLHYTHTNCPQIMPRWHSVIIKTSDNITEKLYNSCGVWIAELKTKKED